MTKQIKKRRYKIWYNLETETLTYTVMKTEKELEQYIYTLKLYKKAKNIDVELLKEESTELTLW